jgi:pyruvate dehydrogenase E2 component (dihydrolipoamide acetyltransferase)
MAETVSMPKLGFDMAEGTLVRWVKAEGETVNKGDVLAEIETDKATVEVESPYTGTVLQQLVEEKTSVPVGTPIAIIGEPGEKVEAAKEGKPKQKKAEAESTALPAAEPEAVKTVTAEAAPAGDELLRASPLAKKMAEDAGLDLGSIEGSGPKGRVVKKDVEAAMAAVKAPVPAAPKVPPAAAAVSTPAVSLPLPSVIAGEIPADQHVPLDRLRAAIGRRMTESKQQLPHFYITHEYDMAAVMDVRKQANELLPDEQKLSVNDFIVKAVALALRDFPNLNASLVGNEIIRHGHVNVGVAVAVEAGLLTVVCADTDRKPLRVISQEIKDMAARARIGKVRPTDIEGSTFSISNLGMFDVEHFVAIINPPEAAILAVGTAKQVPVVVNGELKVGMRMRATISADHRVSDGAEAAQFMQRLAVYLEKPIGLLL